MLLLHAVSRNHGAELTILCKPLKTNVPSYRNKLMHLQSKSIDYFLHKGEIGQ